MFFYVFFLNFNFLKLSYSFEIIVKIINLFFLN